MAVKPSEMIKTKSRAVSPFEEFKGKDEHSDDTPEKSSESDVQGDSKKLKTRMSDYAGSHIKKTSIEIPQEVLHAWKIDCTVRGVKQRDHLLSILTKDLNKRR